MRRNTCERRKFRTFCGPGSDSSSADMLSSLDLKFKPRDTAITFRPIWRALYKTVLKQYDALEPWNVESSSLTGRCQDIFTSLFAVYVRGSCVPNLHPPRFCSACCVSVQYWPVCWRVLHSTLAQRKPCAIERNAKAETAHQSGIIVESVDPHHPARKNDHASHYSRHGDVQDGRRACYPDYLPRLERHSVEWWFCDTNTERLPRYIVHNRTAPALVPSSITRKSRVWSSWLKLCVLSSHMARHVLNPSEE